MKIDLAWEGYVQLVSTVHINFLIVTQFDFFCDTRLKNLAEAISYDCISVSVVSHQIRSPSIILIFPLSFCDHHCFYCYGYKAFSIKITYQVSTKTTDLHSC